MLKIISAILEFAFSILLLIGIFIIFILITGFVEIDGLFEKKKELWRGK